MADMTVEEALQHAVASDDKTALDAALDTLVAAVTTAGTNGTLSTDSAVQLNSQLKDWAETLASNLRATP